MICEEDRHTLRYFESRSPEIRRSVEISLVVNLLNNTMNENEKDFITNNMDRRFESVVISRSRNSSRANSVARRSVATARKSVNDQVVTTPSTKGEEDKAPKTSAETNLNQKGEEVKKN